MKWFFAIVVLLVGFFAYRTYMDHVRAEADRVAFEQLDRERIERSRQQQAEREAEMARSRRPILAISKTVDPMVLSVAAPLDSQKPYDLVPQLELTKLRILDKQARAEPDRKRAYDRAGEAFDALIALAEERTKLLEEILKNKAKSGALDQPGRPSASADFFNRSVIKRWDEAVARLKPTINQRLEALRAAERAWNAQLGEYSQEEYYDLPSLDPVIITAEAGGDSSSTLGSGANANKNSRVWRRTYYDQNGYRYPIFH